MGFYMCNRFGKLLWSTLYGIAPVKSKNFAHNFIIVGFFVFLIYGTIKEII